MAGGHVGEGARPTASIDHDDRGGDAPGALDRARRPARRARSSGRAEADQRAEHRAELGHLPDGGDAVPGDVADHDHVAAVVEDDALEPVAAHADAAGGGEVAGGAGEGVGVGERGEHVGLEGGDEPVLGVGQLGPLQRLTGDARRPW